jgi:phosphoribosylanthranilate isomerase
LPRSALHLCGQSIFRDLLDPARRPSVLSELSRYSRIQVNINARDVFFQPAEVFSIYRILLDAGLSIMIQLHDDVRALVDRFVNTLTSEEVSRVHILFDASKGKGLLASSWSEPYLHHHGAFFCGYAGGLGPQNMAQQLPLIHQAASAHGSSPYWTDMESGLRTDHQFDLIKAERVLKISADFIAQQIGR